MLIVLTVLIILSVLALFVGDWSARRSASAGWAPLAAAVLALAVLILIALYLAGTPRSPGLGSSS